MKLKINEKSNGEKEVKQYILVDDSDNRIVDSGVNQAVIEIGAKQYIKNAIKSGKKASVSCYKYVKTIGADSGVDDRSYPEYSDDDDEWLETEYPEFL